MTPAQVKARFKAAVKKAKTLWKSGRYKTFGDAVKAAYGKKVSKVGKVVKSKSRQTGTSNKKRDMERSARPPGPRIPKGGRKVTYTERRKNRSDAPGKLTGTAYNEMILRNLHNENTLLSQGEARMKQLKALVRVAPKGADRNKVKGYIKDQAKFIKAKKQAIRMLRILIK